MNQRGDSTPCPPASVTWMTQMRRTPTSQAAMRAWISLQAACGCVFF